MNWVVLALVVLCLLCIAMSCVALWYREEWSRSERMSRRRLDAYDECRRQRDWLQEELRQANEMLLRFPMRDSRGRYCKRK